MLKYCRVQYLTWSSVYSVTLYWFRFKCYITRLRGHNVHTVYRSDGSRRLSLRLRHFCWPRKLAPGKPLVPISCRQWTNPPCRIYGINSLTKLLDFILYVKTNKTLLYQYGLSHFVNRMSVCLWFLHTNVKNVITIPRHSTDQHCLLSVVT